MACFRVLSYSICIDSLFLLAIWLIMLVSRIDLRFAAWTEAADPSLPLPPWTSLDGDAVGAVIDLVWVPDWDFLIDLAENKSVYSLACVGCSRSSGRGCVRIRLTVIFSTKRTKLEVVWTGSRVKFDCSLALNCRGCRGTVRIVCLRKDYTLDTALLSVMIVLYFMKVQPFQ